MTCSQHDAIKAFSGHFSSPRACSAKVFEPMEGCNSCAALNDARTRSTLFSNPPVSRHGTRRSRFSDHRPTTDTVCAGRVLCRQASPGSVYLPRKTLSPGLNALLREIAATPKVPDGGDVQIAPKLSDRLREACSRRSRHWQVVCTRPEW